MKLLEVAKGNDPDTVAEDLKERIELAVATVNGEVTAAQAATVFGRPGLHKKLWALLQDGITTGCVTVSMTGYTPPPPSAVATTERTTKDRILAIIGPRRVVAVAHLAAQCGLNPYSMGILLKRYGWLRVKSPVRPDGKREWLRVHPDAGCTDVNDFMKERTLH